jgi:hypothetical protein
MPNMRTELQREVAEALVSSKAVNFEQVGTVLAKFGARAAVSGEAIGAIINWRVIDICIPPEPYQVVVVGDLARGASAREA